MALDRSNPNRGSSKEDVVDETVIELRRKYTQTSILDDGDSYQESKLKISDAESIETESIVANTEEIALKALHVDDDPSLNPWTFRVFFLGPSPAASSAHLHT